MSGRACGSTTSRATCSIAARSRNTSTSSRSRGSRPTRRSSTRPSPRARFYDEAIRKLMKSGLSGEPLFFELAIEDSVARGRPVPARAPAHGDRRRLGVARGVAAARLRHQGDHRRGQAPLSEGRQAEPVHQDPRHQGRSAGDRGVDLLRRDRQRDAAVLRRPTISPRPTPT